MRTPLRWDICENGVPALRDGACRDAASGWECVIVGSPSALKRVLDWVGEEGLRVEGVLPAANGLILKLGVVECVVDVEARPSWRAMSFATADLGGAGSEVTVLRRCSSWAPVVKLSSNLDAGPGVGGGDKNATFLWTSPAVPLALRELLPVESWLPLGVERAGEGSDVGCSASGLSSSFSCVCSRIGGELSAMGASLLSSLVRLLSGAGRARAGSGSGLLDAIDSGLWLSRCFSFSFSTL